MILYPAIDLRGGKCVRLTQGNYDAMTVYHDNPVAVAKGFCEAGAQWLHVVDLDGARSGEPENLSVIVEISRATGLPVETGGGIRTMETLDKIMDAGVARAILGTSAVKDPAFLKAAVEKYGDRVAVGIDARDGYVAIAGWEEKSEFTATDFAKKMQILGVRTIIYTDISRDGMLQGPNLEAMQAMAEAVPGVDVIASGGVAVLSDLTDLTRTGVGGAIIGKALYTGGVDLQAAVTAIKGVVSC